MLFRALLGKIRGDYILKVLQPPVIIDMSICKFGSYVPGVMSLNDH